MRGCLGCFGTLVILLAIAVGGGYLYLVGPDLPPLTADLPSLQDLPFLRPADGPATTEAEPIVQQTNSLLDEAMGRFATREEPALRIAAALKQAGVPVTFGTLEAIAGEKTVLLLASPYRSGLAAPGLARGFRTMVDLAERPDINLTGIDQVVLMLQDDQGRTLVGIAAPSSALLSYRAATITQAELIRTMAIKAESRAAILDAMRQEAGQ